MSIKTLFLGSNYEALATLRALHESNKFEITGVITQPDKPVGRKQELLPTEIKTYCIENNIQVFHTESQEERYKEALELFKPELIVCKSFGEMIPGFFLEAPKYKAINIHFSLLPQYRGAVPIQMAILNGDKKTGISIVQMVEKLDAGPILAQYEEDILPDDTNESLRKRLVQKTTEVITEILTKWVNGQIQAMDQDESKVTFCWKKDISKENAEINWDEKTSEEIDRMVRALIPWPIAWCILNNKRTKIFKVSMNTYHKNLNPGEIAVDKKRLYIGTKDSSIEIMELQPDGKKILNAEQYINGIKAASIQ